MLIGLALCKLALLSWLRGCLELSFVKLSAQVLGSLTLAASHLPFPQMTVLYSSRALISPQVISSFFSAEDFSIL